MNGFHALVYKVLTAPLSVRSKSEKRFTQESYTTSFLTSLTSGHTNFFGAGTQGAGLLDPETVLFVEEISPDDNQEDHEKSLIRSATMIKISTTISRLDFCVFIYIF